MTAQTRAASGSEPAMDDPLRVDLRIELPDEVQCAVADVDGEVTGVSQHLKHGDCECATTDRPEDAYGECHAEVALEAGTGTRHEYLRSAVQSGCVCRVFAATDCIPEIRSVGDGTMEVSLTLPDRHTLRDVVATVRETGATVRLERAVRRGDGGGHTIEIDSRDITPKQREAIKVAVDEGYYEEPRAVDLDELAGRLGVSKSAVSQRLNAVESKLVLSLTGER